MIALVTGGAGFIGSHLVDRLLAQDTDVRIFDIVEPRWRSDVEYSCGSILDVEGLTRAMQGVDVVFHLAAVANVNEIYQRPDFAETVNTRGTLNVLEASRRSRVRKIVYASTVWVYDGCEGEVVDEETLLHPPRHLYTATKVAAEGYCHAYQRLYGVTSTILRYGVPYGPRSREGTVVTNFVERALRRQPIVIAGAGDQWRRFVYVEDLAEANVLALSSVSDNRVYNLDGRERVTIRRVADTVRRIIGDVHVQHTDARPGDFSGKEASSERAKRELGWEPHIGFDEGIRRYIDWYRAVRSLADASSVIHSPGP